MSNKPSFDQIGESNPDKPSIAERTRTTNEEGAEAFEPFTDEFGLYKVVINNLLEDSFYDDVDESFEKVWNRFDEVADTNPEFVLQLAVYARQEEGFRDIAQLLLVLSANDPRTQEYVREYAPYIMDRTDEFNSVLSYQLRGYGKPVPKPLKKGITDALHLKYGIVTSEEFAGQDEIPDEEVERVTWVEGVDPSPDGVILDEGYVHDEYTFSKYSQRDKEVSMHDVLNLVRPKPRSDERNQMFASIAKGELDQGTTAKDHWDVGPNWDPSQVEPLREERTWESEMSEDDDRTDAEKFRARLDDMGLMARVRNLRNMREAGIPGSDIFNYDQ